MIIQTLFFRQCLNYHIGLCTAPCINNVSKEEYAKQVHEVSDFLKGNTKKIITQLKEEMQRASQEQRYEVALECKRSLEAISHLGEKQKVDLIKQVNQDVIVCKNDSTRAIFSIMSIKKGVISGKQQFIFEIVEDLFESFLKQYYSTRTLPHEIIVSKQFWQTESDKVVLEEYFSSLRESKVTITLPQRGEKSLIVALAQKNLHIENPILEEIKEMLNLPTQPHIIEFFDISNLSSTHIVAGMTRFVDGQADTSGYRKFKIKTVEGKNDDFASMHEVIRRRYRRLRDEQEVLPDLVVVDGGMGQLSAALRAMKEIGIHIPLVALAKQEEELYVPGQSVPIRNDSNSSVMLFFRKMRDTTHRFAIMYNRKRRQMALRDDE